MLRGIESKADVSGFVLAGGQSSRMGSDKGLALFRGRTLLENAIEILSLAGTGDVRIAGARSPLGNRAEVIADAFTDVGPIGGIHAGLSASASEWNLFLPVDMPLMPPSLLAVLMARAEITGCAITVTRLNGRVEPFPVVLHRLALSGLTEQIKAGRTGCHAAWQAIPSSLGQRLDAISVEYLVQAGQCRSALGLPSTLWFQSANTAADLAYLNGVCRS